MQVLHGQGVDADLIAERFGCSPSTVCEIIAEGKRRAGVRPSQQGGTDPVRLMRQSITVPSYKSLFALKYGSEGV